MAAPERFAEKSDSSCTAGTVHTWPLAPDHVLMDRGRYRSRSGHVRTSALTISVENDPKCPLELRFLIVSTVIRLPAGSQSDFGGSARERSSISGFIRPFCVESYEANCK
jgi:hypothetical protein